MTRDQPRLRHFFARPKKGRRGGGGGGWGGGGESDTFFSFLKFFGQFSRHGVEVSMVHHQPLWQAKKDIYIYNSSGSKGGGGGGVYSLTPQPPTLINVFLNTPPPHLYILNLVFLIGSLTVWFPNWLLNCDSWSKSTEISVWNWVHEICIESLCRTRTQTQKG